VLARLANIDLRAELPALPSMQDVDYEILKRVLENLLSNALKYSEEGSSVTVCLQCPTPDRAIYRIEVHDLGPGIDPSYRERIFEKFEVAALKQSGVAQTGVGLAFSRKAIEAHGGVLYMKENQPHGSIFTIELPTEHEALQA
ncbi:MAG: ATP-binding protein, partial [Caldilineaceae bacterium]|nr:ATP-binding protein [Caldilineaceae bacterium]